MIRPCLRVGAVGALLLGAVAACGDMQSDGAGASTTDLQARSAPNDATPKALVSEIGRRFHRVVPRLERAPARSRVQPAKTPFLATPRRASFSRAADGSLTALVEDEMTASAPGAATKRNHLAVRFPADSSGETEVTIGDEDGAWIHERLAGASKAEVGIADGRLVYAAAKAGVDRVYEVTGQRVEEWLCLADASRAADVAYQIETGPAIANLVVDGSGAGLVAVDGDGVAIVKAPAPVGVDANGEPVEGRLVAERTGAHAYSVRVELDTASPTFPVLLDPSWVSAGSMATARYFHTANLLANGKVLVAGGTGIAGGAVASAELYDPATGTWSATGSLSTPREYHTASTLSNGSVLAAGGSNGSGPVTSAELYDAMSGTWSPTASMATPRDSHSATVLADGRVMVAGGALQLATVELYDPASASWSSTGPMAMGHYDHTATLLPSGKVLVQGGWDEWDQLGALDTELYEPSLGTWSGVGGSPSPHGDPHGAVLLPSGKVLVAGGYWGGGIGINAGPVAGADLYDPTTSTWSAAAPMTTGRDGLTLSLLPDGKVLAAGGIAPGGNTPSAELFDPTTGAWASTASMTGARWGHTATVLPNGNVLAAGGYDNVNVLADAQLFVLNSANGAACSVAGDCASGFCVDGVCCDTVCNAGACDACSVAAGGTTDGTCSLLTGPVCDDGDACTQVDICQAGVCVGSNPVGCTASDPCHTVGTCDPATGMCSNPQAPNGTTCDDGDACTKTDVCMAGVCTGSDPVECKAADACHEDGACDPATGMCSIVAKADGASCDDGDGCTKTDVCKAGVCEGKEAKSCPALDECHEEGACQPETGDCSNPKKPDGTVCSIGTCEDGTCTGGGTGGGGTSGAGGVGSGTSSSGTGGSVAAPGGCGTARESDAPASGGLLAFGVLALAVASRRRRRA